MQVENERKNRYMLQESKRVQIDSLISSLKYPLKILNHRMLESNEGSPRISEKLNTSRPQFKVVSKRIMARDLTPSREHIPTKITSHREKELQETLAISTAVRSHREHIPRRAIPQTLISPRSTMQ